YPLPENAKKLFSKKKIVVLENNVGAQFANLLKLEYGVKILESILKYDGDPFSVEEVVTRLKQSL
ncbi:MAG: 2-oxoacid:acceptor oxidoreductase subunit alpha, partial [Candidatus Moranbacteria bacterium CG_4_8_14_3_um_filter_41_13]